MADSKISALPASTTPLAGTEVLPIVQSGATKQVSVANLTAGRAVATGALTVTGDATLSTGNLIPSTAAKGVNFTANTPAAGMTSQLLNWYEQGTWTPTQGGGLVVLGTFSSAGNYTRIGNIVYLQGFVAGSTSVAFANGGATICGGLPFAANTSSPLQVGLGINADNTTSAPFFAYSSSLLSSGTFAATSQYHFSVFYRI
jgi:hypothetical protein